MTRAQNLTKYDAQIETHSNMTHTQDLTKICRTHRISLNYSVSIKYDVYTQYHLKNDAHIILLKSDAHIESQ